MARRSKFWPQATFETPIGLFAAAANAAHHSAKTMNGKELTIKVTDNEVQVDDASVLTTDIAASNGVIHVIDTVIVPAL